MAFFLLINSSSRLHRCCQSDNRYAESTRKIVMPEHIQRGRNFRRFEAGRRYKVTAEKTSVAQDTGMLEIACGLTTVKCTKDARR